MKKLFIVADWAFDSLTQAEVKIAIEGFLKQSQNANISFIAATPSTIHTGFLISQLVEDIERYGQPLESVIFQNTDPRLHTKRGLAVIMKLKSGLYLIGPNSGYDFSLIKNRIDELFIYKGLNDKGQFHSRDLYSRISAHLMDYLEDELELEEVNVDNIPDLKGFFVGHIDNFGNMKTTITQENFKGIKYFNIDKVKKSVGLPVRGQDNQQSRTCYVYTAQALHILDLPNLFCIQQPDCNQDNRCRIPSYTISNPTSFYHRIVPSSVLSNNILLHQHNHS